MNATIIRNIIAPLWARHERSDYLEVAARLRRTQRSLSPDERRSIQLTTLTGLLKHAWETVPWYREKWAAVGFDPRAVRSLDDMAQIPILDKADIQENRDRLVSTAVSRRELIPRKTSGSTGVSLNFFTTEKEFQPKRGITLFRDEWTGWRLGEWRAMVWGNPEYRHSVRGHVRNALLERGLYLDTLEMGSDDMAAFAREIGIKKPTLLFGHAHSLYLFAGYVEKNGLTVKGLKGILSTAMVLHKHERKKCVQVFGAPVFDRYGCEEVSLIASECEAHQGLHVNTDSLIVEVMPDQKSAAADGAGAVVVTDLCNRAMPFIRYRVGDMARISSRQCSCGRTYPLLEGIAGRIADYLITPDGKWVSGISLTENFATLIPGMGQLQIVQDASDHLTLRYTAGESFNEKSISAITRLVEERFGSRMRFTLAPVEKITPEKSGKYRFTICKIPH